MSSVSRIFSLFVAVACFASPAASAVYSRPCPLYGLDLPVPTSLSTAYAFQAASKSFEAQLTAAVQGSSNATALYGDFDGNTSAFSLEFYSVNEDKPLFTYHSTPVSFKENNTGTLTVDSDSIYRIGSVSKLWTVYVFLIAAGDASWNDPITKYVPELYAIAQENDLNAVARVSWDSVTVGALAGQMAGIGRDAVYNPAIATTLEQLGVPNPGGNNHSTCGSAELEVMIPCNRSRKI